MQIYEIGYLILSSIPEDKVPQVVEAIKSTISKGGGKEIDSESPILQPLAYEMAKTIGASKYVLKEAYFGWVKFEAEPEEAVKIKEGMDKIEEMVRFLIVKAPRETFFTFAKARAKAQEKEQATTNPGEPAEAPAEEMVVE